MNEIRCLIVSKISFSVFKVLVVSRRTWNILCWGNHLSAGFADMLLQTSASMILLLLLLLFFQCTYSVIASPMFSIITWTLSMKWWNCWCYRVFARCLHYVQGKHGCLFLTSSLAISFEDNPLYSQHCIFVVGWKLYRFRKKTLMSFFNP